MNRQQMSLERVDNLSRALVGASLFDFAETVRMLSQQYNTAKANLDHLERYRQVVISRLILVYLRAGEARKEKVTQTRAENEARASPEYEQFLNQMHDAHEDMNRKAEVYFEARNHYDALMALLHAARDEAKMLGSMPTH